MSKAAEKPDRLLCVEGVASIAGISIREVWSRTSVKKNVDGKTAL
jgi:hypothetical protein